MTNDKLNSFTIAHYILMFFVVVLCIGIVAWVLIHDRPSVAAPNNSTTPDCATTVRNKISQMWAYNPELIPTKYQDMASLYANENISVRTYGRCNNVAYLCRPGQIRRNCDPCALMFGMEQARERHINDATKIMCGKK